MRLSPTKVLLTVSPFRSFLFPPASVFSQRPLPRQPNFYAAWPSSAFSAACRLFVSLCSLFRTRFLCFHELADSFAKIPGGYLGTSAPCFPPSYAPRGASIPCGLTRLRILPVTTGGVPPTL